MVQILRRWESSVFRMISSDLFFWLSAHVGDQAEHRKVQRNHNRANNSSYYENHSRLHRFGEGVTVDSTSRL